MYHNEDFDKLREALLGRSVVSVRMTPDDARAVDKYGPKVQGEVHLDDGSVLLLAGNVGGCICGAGDYSLTQLNDMPINGITNVEVEVEAKESKYEEEKVYRIFVAAFGGRFPLATFEGDDGNGYYGTGFSFSVVR